MPDQLIDNQEYRLADAINAIVPHASVGRFAVGYFFVSGFNAVADHLSQLDKLYLLIGTTTNRETLEQLALGYRRRTLIEEKLREQRFSPVDRAMGETLVAISQHISELQPGEREERTIGASCTPRPTSSTTATRNPTPGASASSGLATSPSRA
jgi:hypothetical protein